MATPPLRTEISDTYPNPSDAVARIGFGRLYDYVVGLLGSTGNSVEARTALGAAKAGVNSDLTSISTITGMGNGNVTQIQVTATGGVGINTVPDTSAVFDIQSTTKGLKIPKMTNAQKIAIANTEALIVYDTTLKTVSVNNGVVWGSVGGGASGGGLDIVNGDFRIAQAGTSFPAAANGAYDLDGWSNGNSSTAVFTASQVTGSTAGRLARRITVTTVDTAVTAGKVVVDATKIEGYNIEKYVGQTFTISFRATVPVSGIHCVSLRNSGSDRSYIKEINFPTANVWQDCSFTVVSGLPTAGTWDYINGVGLLISFTHMAGTSFQTAPDAWQTGNFLGTANQVNDCATVGNVWAMEKVTMNLGTVAAVSEISYEAELIRCQRYLPVWSAATSQSLGASGMCYSTTAAEFTLPYQVQPRVAPTGITATANRFAALTATGTLSPAVTPTINGSVSTLQGLSILLVGTSGLAAGNGTLLYTTAGGGTILATGCRL